MSKLQVGLLGSARSLQRDLERIAGRADTNTPDGLHYVLQGEHARLVVAFICLSTAAEIGMLEFFEHAPAGTPS